MKVPAARALQALAAFIRLEAVAGTALMAAAAIALLVANSPWADGYFALRALPLRLGIDAFAIDKPLLSWINDGLMALFFLLVALEIKREVLSGQLSNRAQLLLPLACAVAGVVVPALLFWLVNRDDPASLRGWAIPTATDIAFALGILALLGARASTGMRLLLSTIAVVDDLIAIVIIAVFYAHGTSLPALAGAVMAIAAMGAMNRAGVRAVPAYLALGVVLWLCVLQSGVHATLAGVITGFLVPHRAARGAMPSAARSPLESLEHVLHPWVAFAVLPLFAFANAGLSLQHVTVDRVLQPLPIGIALGLILGKPIGIVGAAVGLRALRLVQFPDGMGLRAMVGLGLLCGIGFTMSLFIGSLAFAQDAARQAASVGGVLLASLLSALLGYAWLRTMPRVAPAPAHTGAAR